MLLAFSRTVRRCSLARPGELKLWKREVSHPWQDPIDVFAREATSLLWGLVALQSQRPVAKTERPRVITGDSETVLDSIRDVDLVLTSPPYGDAWTTVAYGNFSMLSRIWLSALDAHFAEHSPAREDARSLGGADRLRRGFSVESLTKLSPYLKQVYHLVAERSADRASQLTTFCQDFYSVLRKIVAASKPESRVVMVLGPRRVATVWIDTGAVVADFLQTMGFQRVDRLDRKISGKRLPSVTLQGEAGLGSTINRETIDVFAAR